MVISDAPQPAVALSSSSLDFGPVAARQTSAAKTLTLTNTGAGPLTISGSAITGAQATSRSSADGCTGQVVAAGATCTVTVSFHPPAVGARSARLAFTDNASGSPHTIALTGEGTTTGIVTGTVKDGSRAGTPPLPGAAITLCQIDAEQLHEREHRRRRRLPVRRRPAPGPTWSRSTRRAARPSGRARGSPTSRSARRPTPPRSCGKDAPLPSGVRISSGTGSAAGGHPVLYWDAPFAIDVPPLKAPGAHGTPNSTVSTTVFVELRTAGSGQTVIGSALTYSVSYDASGAAVRAVATSAALPGVISAGFSFTLGDIAIPTAR